MNDMVGERKWANGIEYSWHGKALGWRVTGRAGSLNPSLGEPGVANTSQLGEPEGSRDAEAAGRAWAWAQSQQNAQKTFPHAKYDDLVAETVIKLKQLSALKGGEYAGDEDRLANFRRNGEILGLPMETVWATYYNKHHDAVMQYCKDLVHGKKRERLEPLAGRLDDMIVYCILFKAMLAERDAERVTHAQGSDHPAPPGKDSPQ